MRTFRFLADAGERYPGNGHFTCYPATKAEPLKASRFQEGDVVMVIGYTTGEIVGAPNIGVLEVLPYQGCQ